MNTSLLSQAFEIANVKSGTKVVANAASAVKKAPKQKPGPKYGESLHEIIRDLNLKPRVSVDFLA